MAMHMRGPLHGYGPLVLKHIPRKAPGLTVRQIEDSFNGAVRPPSPKTIRRHVQELVRMGVVAGTQTGDGISYTRLVNSDLEVSA